MSNLYFDRRADNMSAAEKQAIETLKANGWTAIADVYIQDGIPEKGDGSPTYRFEGRKHLAVFKSAIEPASAPDPEPEDDEDGPETEPKKKRGRPPKVVND